MLCVYTHGRIKFNFDAAVASLLDCFKFILIAVPIYNTRINTWFSHKFIVMGSWMKQKTRLTLLTVVWSSISFSYFFIKEDLYLLLSTASTTANFLLKKSANQTDTWFLFIWGQWERASRIFFFILFCRFTIDGYRTTYSFRVIWQ